MAKTDEKTVSQSFQTRKRYRFLAKKEIGAAQPHIAEVYNSYCCKEISLIR